MDSCTEPKETCFSIQLKHIENFDIQDKVILNEPRLDTLDANQFAILLKGIAQEKICVKNFKKSSTLFANTFNTGEIIHKDIALHISIISSGDINDEYTAGKELKSLFIPIGFEPRCYGSNTDSANDCFVNYYLYEGIHTLEEAYNEIFAHNYYLNERNNTSIRTPMFLMKPGINASLNIHEFTIEIEYQTGRKDVLTTSEIILR